ncbi:succinylglutamate desuccinylase/aspartoacylase family protein [Marinoscillum sp. MHG1-6]|uniref:succinylglutamate desuccinylase/aspartoacylase family protein n=1 Tax=Marinoscillum sp. MHG1-6 TaxID=2959627 RepID=UPI002157D0CD|nr:succinylglutamate desuccinylase/aspartoacylase family protein [Marinoscillum sp. MHG1-6]
MNINGRDILPGQEKNIRVAISKLPSHTPIDISITVYNAEQSGPTVLLMGGMHGDEINGVEIVRRMIENGYHRVSKGATICIPVLNVYGFIHFSRTVPDGKDVNRSFPGNKNGSLAARMADYLMKDVIPQIDLGVDFHTGGAERTNYPQTRCVMKDEQNVEMATAFHAPFALDSPYRSSSLRWAAAKQGKRILVYEGGQSSRFDEYAIQEGINGTRRLLRHLGMADDAPEPQYDNLRLKSSSWIRARKSGLFQPLVQSGDKVNRNQVVGYLADPFGEFKKSVKSKVGGYVIGLNNNPLLHEGDAIMHIGVI